MKKYLFVFILMVGLYLSMTALAQKKQSTLADVLTIHVSGLKGKPLENVLSRLATRTKLLEAPTPNNVSLFYQHASKEIRLGIQPYGYFQPPKIRTKLVKKQLKWIAYFDVTPGPRTKISKISIQISGPGKHFQPFAPFIQKPLIQVGDYFDSNIYETLKDTLINLASHYGFFDSKMIKSNVSVDKAHNQASIIILFDTGSRYQFGDTHFISKSFAYPFLKRFLRYQPGDYFDQEQLIETRRVLINSGYFSNVALSPMMSKKHKHIIPIKANLKNHIRIEYNFGAGYGTNTGIRGIASTNVLWINQYGHRLDGLLKLAKTNSEIAAHYYMPGSDPAKDLYTLSGSYLNENYVPGTGNNISFDAAYRTYLGNWKQTVKLTALAAEYQYRTTSKQTSFITYPSIVWQRHYKDDTLFTQNGYTITFAILAAQKNLLSNTSFFQTTLDTRFLFTILERTRVILRASMGYTDIAQIQDLPLSLQLLSGGPNTLRGYRYNSIGPGKELFVGSLEIQEKIILQHLYLTVFCDIGNVSNHFFDKKLKIGLGPGLAFVSPIGTFELTFAKAVSQPKQPWVIQFSIGETL